MHHGGTLCYIAPEVHRGQDFDEGCDVYAFAITLWELLTLGQPFSDKPPQAIPGEGCDVYALAVLHGKIWALGQPFSDEPPRTFPGTASLDCDRAAGSSGIGAAKLMHAITSKHRCTVFIVST